MREHLAAVKKPYLDAILDGRKTIELRLARIARPPFRAIERGDRIWFKMSGGAVLAQADAGRVEFFDHLTPEIIKDLRSEYDRSIRGADAYWQTHLNCRCATLIWLENVRAVDPFMPEVTLRTPWLVLNKRLLPADDQ